MLNEAGEPSSLFNTTTFQWWKRKFYVLLFLKGIGFKEGCQLWKQSDEMHTKSCMSPMPKLFNFSAQVKLKRLLSLTNQVCVFLLQTVLAAFWHHWMRLRFQHHHRFIICDQQFRNFKCQVNKCTNSWWTSLLLGLLDNSRLFLAQVLLKWTAVEGPKKFQSIIGSI